MSEQPEQAEQPSQPGQSGQRLTELKEKLFQLERRIRPLEWDAMRNQINEYKRQELARLKEEQKVLVQELQGLQQPSS